MNPRHLFTAGGVALVAVLLVGQFRQLLADPSIWPPDDFVEYWAAARLTLQGHNPYDPDLLLPIEVAAGRTTESAVMMWNPPWTLAVILPLGGIPAREAQLLWLAINLAAIGFCGDRLWLLSGGGRTRRWLGWAVAFAFLPTLFALQSGQISPILLLGAVLYLECLRHGWSVLAGAATVLLAVKPHLAYLVWAAIVCEAAATRRIGAIVGGLAAGIVATLVPLAFDPSLLGQYVEALRHRPPAQWISPTLGAGLRWLYGEERFHLQFIPVAFGLAWFAIHWRWARNTWNWNDQLPLLLLISFVTAPYGAWPFDMVLLLPAVIQIVRTATDDLSSPFPRCQRTAYIILVLLFVLNCVCLAMNLVGVWSFTFIWVAPAILLLYLLGIQTPPARTTDFQSSRSGGPSAVSV